MVSSPTCFTVALALLPLARAQELLPSKDLYRATQYPLGILATDADGDGLDDLLYAHRGSVFTIAELLWQRATGPGQFAALTPFRTSEAGIGAVSLGDIDLDGDLDLLTLGAAAPSLGPAIYLKTPSGFSVEPILDSLQLPPLDAAWFADFDGDQLIDLVEAGPASPSFNLVARLRRGNGTAHLGPAERFDLGLLGSSISLLDPLDIDGDGDLDLLFFTQEDILRIARYDRTVGGFGTAEVLDPTSDRVLSVIRIDVTADGVPDLVYAPRSAPEVIRVLPGAIDGSFGDPIDLPFVPEPDAIFRTYLLAADVNDDGELDLLILANRSSHWMRGLGGGTFAAVEPLTEGAAIDGNPTATSLEPALVDVNEDGRADLVTGFALTTRWSAPAVALSQVEGDRPFEAPRKIGAGINEQFIHGVGDVDADGQSELVVMQTIGGVLPAVIEVAERKIVGGALTPIGEQTPVRDLGLSGVLQLVLDDLTQDGRDDAILVTADNELMFLAADPARVFASPSMIGTASRAVKPVFEDIDGDGQTDVVAAEAATDRVIWFRNLGSGSFAPAVPLRAFDERVRQIRFVDLDQDGSRDLVLAEYRLPPLTPISRVTWSPRTGNEFLAPRQLSPEIGDEILTVAAGDIDGDGWTDLAWGTRDVDWVYWVRNLGDGTFAPRERLRPMGVPCRQLELADVNLDGAADLFVRVLFQTRYAINAGDGEFPTRVTLFNSPLSMTLDDVDEDRDPDLVIAANSRGLQFLENPSVQLIGSPICGPAIENASGRSARISASGSASVEADDVRLMAAGLPASTFGFFLTSQSSRVTFPVQNSRGRLCLEGGIGRYSGSGQILASGGEGQFELNLDLTAIQTPTGTVPAVAGETRYFQAWFRDRDSAGQSTSNFTDALQIHWI